MQKTDTKLIAKVNAALAALKASGEYQKVYDKVLPEVG